MDYAIHWPFCLVSASNRQEVDTTRVTVPLRSSTARTFSERGRARRPSTGGSIRGPLCQPDYGSIHQSAALNVRDSSSNRCRRPRSASPPTSEPDVVSVLLLSSGMIPVRFGEARLISNNSRSYYPEMAVSTNDPVESSLDSPVAPELDSDSDVVRRFETCAWGDASFRHRDHVHLAWIYVRRLGREAAE